MTSSGEDLISLYKSLVALDQLVEKRFAQGRLGYSEYERTKVVKFYARKGEQWVVPPRYRNFLYEKNPISIEESESLQLRKEQENLVNELRSSGLRFATIIGRTGFGKTIIMYYLLSKIKERGLVLVPTRKLLRQTVSEFKKFGLEAGVYGDGHKELDKGVTVMTFSGFGKLEGKQIKENNWRVLMIDEAHRFLTNKHIKNLLNTEPNYLYAVTATPVSNRFNKQANVFEKLFGPQIGNADILLQPEIQTFYYKNPYTLDFENFTKDRKKILDTDQERLNKQRDIIVQLARDRKYIMVLYDRVNHCLAMEERLKILDINAQVIIGDRDGDERAVVKKEIAENGGVLIATAATIGIGFDLPELDTLFLAYPNKFDGNVIQNTGRILRLLPGKTKPLLVDFIDTALIHQYKKRLMVYKSVYKQTPKSFILKSDYYQPKTSNLFTQKI